MQPPPPPPTLRRADIVVLTVGAVFLHLTWASGVDGPIDYDAQYYLIVARHLAAGDGPITAGLWNLAWLPPSLPAPADTYWMPLPSRVLVPELWLWPASFGVVTNAILAATAAPLGAWLAADLGLTRRGALGAGVVAAIGGLYARLLVMPDVYALYAAIGGLGLFAVARDRWRLAALAAVLAALTRSDGFTLGLALAVGLRGWGPRVAVAAAGLVAAGAWTVRSVIVGGTGVLEARALAVGSTAYIDLYDGVLREPLTALGRVQAIAGAGPDIVSAWLAPGLAVLTPAAAWGAWKHRRVGWVRALVAFSLLAPLLTWGLAPAVAGHGTLYRAMAASLAGHGALAAVGLLALGAASHRLRDYPPLLLPVMLGLSYALAVAVKGVARTSDDRRPPDPCALVADLPPTTPVFTAEPLALELHCGRPGVLLTTTTPEARVRAIAARYGVTHALIEGADRTVISLDAAGMDARFPTWEPDGARRRRVRW